LTALGETGAKKAWLITVRKDAFGFLRTIRTVVASMTSLRS
jgi:hypothetical protein